MKLKVGDRVKGLIDLTARGLVVEIKEHEEYPYRVAWHAGSARTLAHHHPDKTAQSDDTIAPDEDPMERLVRRRRANEIPKG